MKNWSTVICIASGPSLALSDCDLVIQSGLPIIAINDSWRAVPDCDVIYAGDWRWWQSSIDSLPEVPERWSCSEMAKRRFGTHYFNPPDRGTFNSGQRAILFAVSHGAKNIILLGYDCSLSNGSHWHGDHTTLNNPTPTNIKRWHGEFNALALQQRGRVNIINCSRETALECFERQRLADTIERLAI